MQTLLALLHIIGDAFRVCDRKLADSIGEKNWRNVVLNIIKIAAMVIGIALVAMLLIYLAVRLWGILLIGAFVYWLLSGPASNGEGIGGNGGGNDGGTRYEYDGDDEVEVELKRQKAIDIQEVVADLAFLSIQATSSVTALARPHDKYDIIPARPDGSHFYLYKNSYPIFQWEAMLESEIDKEQENIIQRELQRNIGKHLSRFPMLMSTEVRGRAAVEVLDVKNLGDHVLIEMVLVDAKSLPLVEASRRARIERQIKQERNRTYVDEEYFE